VLARFEENVAAQAAEVNRVADIRQHPAPELGVERKLVVARPALAPASHELER